MNDILNLLQNSLGSAGVSAIADKLGTDDAATKKLLSTVAPVVVGGLAKNAAQPDGAHALNAALEKDHDGSILDDAMGFISADTGAMGAGILGHVLGKNQSQIQRNVARATDLDPKVVGAAFTLFAPLVMGALGKEKKAAHLDDAGLGSLLQQEADKHAGGGLLSRLLDKDGDGDVADDLMKSGLSTLQGMFK